MELIAYRPEYRIYLHAASNHILYERLEEMTLATELPHYVPDVQRVLKLVEPGFTLLSDLRRTLGPNLQMLAVYQQVWQMLLDHGVGLMVEVYPATPSMPKFMQQVRPQSAVPTHVFTSMPEDEDFLRQFRARPAS